LLRLLSEVLSLPTGRDGRLDLATALDWYKIVDDSVAPTDWSNTPTGDLVTRMKYWTSKPSVRRSSADTLIGHLSSAIDCHPLYRSAPTILTVPGSGGDGNSVGEYVAAGVAEQTGKTLLRTVGPAREPRKGGGAVGGLDGLFTLDSMIHGSCIVVDDVFRSGASMKAVALAARRGGATHVYGLAAAKTISG
jgi:hypothetical protein